MGGRKDRPSAVMQTVSNAARINAWPPTRQVAMAACEGVYVCVSAARAPCSPTCLRAVVFASLSACSTPSFSLVMEKQLVIRQLGVLFRPPHLPYRAPHVCQ